MSEQQSTSGYHWTILNSTIVGVGILVLVGLVIVLAIILARHYGLDLHWIYQSVPHGLKDVVIDKFSHCIDHCHPFGWLKEHIPPATEWLKHLPRPKFPPLTIFP